MSTTWGDLTRWADLLTWWNPVNEAGTIAAYTVPAPTITSV